MAKWTFDGMDEYIRELNKLETNTDEIIGKAVYEGANIVANAVRANIEALPAENDVEAYKAYRLKEQSPLTKQQKQGLLDGFGIASMIIQNGYYHVKLGFDGYNTLKSKRYPNGQPNVLIARLLENGSSSFKRRPFIKPAVRSKTAECEKTMGRVFDEEIEKLMK